MLQENRENTEVDKKMNKNKKDKKDSYNKINDPTHFYNICTYNKFDILSKVSDLDTCETNNQQAVNIKHIDSVYQKDVTKRYKTRIFWNSKYKQNNYTDIHNNKGNIFKHKERDNTNTLNFDKCKNKRCKTCIMANEHK